MAQSLQLSDYAARFQALGAKAVHLRRIWRAWLGQGAWEMPPDKRFPAALEKEIPAIRAELEAIARFGIRQSAQADSVKLLVQLADGQVVESVLLPRQALCISTQVGCAVGCVFCATGRGGLVRQLTSAEIVAQAVCALKVRPAIKKIVFMGMGEPAHNWRAVREAIEFLADMAGFAHKQLVVSTVGDRRLFADLAQMRVKPALALSLHTVDEAKRRRLLPRSPAVPVDELLASALDYARTSKYPLQIEWTVIAGVNDSIDEVRALAHKIAGGYAMVNFIAVNPGAGAGFRRPARAHIEDMITVLRQTGIVATLRESAAQDIEGGCGQLRARFLARTSEDGTAQPQAPSPDGTSSCRDDCKN